MGIKGGCWLIADYYILGITLMGNICSDDPYQQIKQLYPKQFQKFIEAQYLEKHITNTFKEAQDAFNASISTVEKQDLRCIKFKKNEVRQHFEEVMQQVDRSYPGGILFLVRIKNVTAEQLLQYNLAERQYEGIQETVKTQIAQQREKANSQITQLRQQELTKLKDSKPVLEKFNALNPIIQADIIAQGEREYKMQIDQKAKQLAEEISAKLRFESVLQNCRALVPHQKLMQIAEEAKPNISRIAVSFVGDPSQATATLF